MQTFETMGDAIQIARQVLAAELDPNHGCGLISEIAAKLGHPKELAEFVALNHDQVGHEALGITANSCVPDILESCHDLLARQA